MQSAQRVAPFSNISGKPRVWQQFYRRLDRNYSTEHGLDGAFRTSASLSSAFASKDVGIIWRFR